MNKLYPIMWLEQPRDIREHLAKIFGIVKTGVAEIRDQEVVSDGVTTQDLDVVSAAKMAEYVGSSIDDTSFAQLWTITVSKAKFELHPPFVITPGNQVLTLEQFNTLKEVSNEEFKQITETPKFCDSCDSLGGRHKKTCIKYK